MITLSQLLYKKIVTKSGKTIDHVQNIKLNGEIKKNSVGVFRISYILYGRKGFLERFGFKKISRKDISWEDVIKITKNAIIVKDR